MRFLLIPVINIRLAVSVANDWNGEQNTERIGRKISEWIDAITVVRLLSFFETSTKKLAFKEPNNI